MTRKGGRPATGSTEWNAEAQRWEVRVTLPRPADWPAGKEAPRKLVPLPGVGEHEGERARRVGKLVSAKVRAGEAVPEEMGESVREYADRWLTARDAKGITTVTDSRSRLNNHVLPFIGGLPIGTIGRDDIERLVEKLDARATHDGGYGWRTALHIWCDVTKMFKDACASKQRDLRVRKDNPAAGVAGPDRGRKKKLNYLWPSEASALLACPEVPIAWRRFYAVSTYLYARPEEIEPLEWSDVDLEHGIVRIHRAVDRLRNVGAVRVTKTEAGDRRIPIEATLLPLLQAMHKAADGKGKVFPTVPKPHSLARKLRDYLHAAKVERAELFANDETRKQINWYHATRSTGITWCACRGDDGVKLMRRAGHERFETTLGYIREAENLSAHFGDVFPPLPPQLVTGVPAVSAGISAFRQPGNERNPANVWAQQGLKVPEAAPSDAVDASRSTEKTAVAAIDAGADPGRVSAPESARPPDADVETTLTRALGEASAAGRWDVVAQLARELEARRLARSPNVVAFDVKRRGG